jgi:protease-4
MDNSVPAQPAAGQDPADTGLGSAKRFSPLRLVSRLFALFSLVMVAVIVVGLIGLTRSLSLSSGEGVQEQYHSLARDGTDKVAIITVEGTIFDGEGFVKKQIEQVRNDPGVKAIVLRVNSPGGTVTASDYLYHHLTELVRERKLPLVVSMGGIAASGGYYMSMAAGPVEDTIFAEPTTWTGSIGVVIPHYNVAGLLEKWRIEEDSIKSHPLKQMGSPAREMTDEERRIFQDLVDDSFNRFKEIVKSGRPKFAKDPEALKRVATGQVFTTRQALANGLVDREGFVEDAIERALELAKLDKRTTQAVRYQRPGGLFDFALSARSEQRRSDLDALLDLTTPRAWYLFTWLARDSGGG